jgi:hypothetical protein
MKYKSQDSVKLEREWLEETKDGKIMDCAKDFLK